MAIHTWHRKPTQLMAGRLLEAFTHAVKVGCTLDEAMTVAGSYTERMTQTSQYTGYPDTLIGIRRGLKMTKQAHNHKVTFANHLPLLRPALAKQWLRPLAKALGIPRAPWQIVVDRLIDTSNDDKANEVRRLFDPEFVHPSPDDVRPSKPAPQPPWQIRAYVAPLPTRTMTTGYNGATTITYVYIDDAPYTLLGTRVGHTSARRTIERFDFEGTPYAAIAAFHYVGLGVAPTNLGQPVYSLYHRRLRDESAE